jgi:hypothetical protein
MSERAGSHDLRLQIRGLGNLPVRLARPRQRHAGAFVELVAQVLDHLNGTNAAAPDIGTEEAAPAPGRLRGTV